MKPEIHTLTGRCGCGAVTIRAQVQKTFGACHCRTCRRWAGGVWMGVVPLAPPEIEGPAKTWVSSKIADRGFCAECGSNIWHRPRHAKDTPTLGQGLFDDQQGWQMTREIFTEERPDHYAFGPGAPGFTAWGTLVAVLTGRLPK